MNEFVSNRNVFALNTKFLIPISMLYVIFCVSADVVANYFTKQGSMILSGATILFPFTYLFSDVVAEVYGYAIARMLVWIMILGEIIFAILVNAIISLTPAYSHLT